MEELLATRDSDSDSATGEGSTMRVSKCLHRPTLPVSGSFRATAAIGGPLDMNLGSAPAASSVDPCPKLHIQKNLFVPFEVLVAAEQGKHIQQCLKNPFLIPVNDPKLWIFYPWLTFEMWAVS